MQALRILGWMWFCLFLLMALFHFADASSPKYGTKLLEFPYYNWKLTKAIFWLIFSIPGLIMALTGSILAQLVPRFELYREPVSDLSPEQKAIIELDQGAKVMHKKLKKRGTVKDKLRSRSREDLVRIKWDDGRVWYCPASDLELVDNERP